MELSEKLEEAFVAYLQTITDWPESLNDENDDPRIVAGESDTEKKVQVVTVVCGDASQEDPPFSGNRWFPLTIEVRTAIDDDSPLGDHKTAAAKLEAALQVSNLSDLVNAAAYAKAVSDPDNFSELDNFCLYPVISRTPTRAQDEELWISGFSLNVYAMGIKGS